MKIAIIGSREGFTYESVKSKLDELIIMKGTVGLCTSPLRQKVNFNDSIISGGASGVDDFAERYAKNNNMDIRIIRPINTSNKLNYLFRNIEIITKADKIIAFWDGKSKGTKFVIDYAKARNKPIEIYYENL